MKKILNNNEIVLQVFKELKDKFIQQDFVIDKSNSKMLEFINKKITLNPKEWIINLGFRKTNVEYVEKELKWYLSQSLYVKDIEGNIPKIWKEVSDINGKINSNYGWMIFSNDNFNQFENSILELENNKFSRRSEMIYQRPNMWIDFNKDGMSDFCCTDGVQLFIRNNKLIYIIKQRSCDIIFGFFNDFSWHSYVYNLCFNRLQKKYPELEIGQIDYNIFSLHLYEKHFNIFEKF